MMDSSYLASPAAWHAADLARDRSWVFVLDDDARAHLAQMTKAVHVEDRPLFDYGRDDFDLGPAAATIHAAMHEALEGRGLAMVKGLPRAGMSEKEFALLNWAIGLNSGVPRPQGRASQYISAVRDAGTVYRSSSGRGYSSNAKLDFHVDGADIAMLGCYNKALSGGQSMVSSSLTAFRLLAEERPDLAEVAQADFHFSRQNEEAPDEAAYYSQPLFDSAEGRLFCKWNRNRVQSAQRIDGVPPLMDLQRETMDALDQILRREDVMFTMFLEPGDLQIMNNHVLLHSRTDFVDHEAPEEKRLLCRLWLAPPNSVRLPDSWGHFFRSTEPGTVRGGILGHNYTDACRSFDGKQAASLGMSTVIA